MIKSFLFSPVTLNLVSSAKQDGQGYFTVDILLEMQQQILRHSDHGVSIFPTFEEWGLDIVSFGWVRLSCNSMISFFSRPPVLLFFDKIRTLTYFSRFQN